MAQFCQKIENEQKFVRNERWHNSAKRLKMNKSLSEMRDGTILPNLKNEQKFVRSERWHNSAKRLKMSKSLSEMRDVQGPLTKSKPKEMTPVSAISLKVTQSDDEG
jgi:hypothetical protein